MRLSSAAIARILSARDVAFVVESSNSTFGPDMRPSDERNSMMTCPTTYSVLIPMLGAEHTLFVEGPGEFKLLVLQALVKRQRERT